MSCLTIMMQQQSPDLTPSCTCSVLQPSDHMCLQILLQLVPPALHLLVRELLGQLQLMMKTR